MPNEPSMDPRFIAAIDMIGRTGARSTQIRWSDDEEPTVWFVVVEHLIGPDGRPAPEGKQHFDVAAGITPLDAAMRLCDQLIDGGHCVHCNRPTGFSHDFERMPADHLICWYQWDPELSTFRRGCEGQA